MRIYEKFYKDVVNDMKRLDTEREKIINNLDENISPNDCIELVKVNAQLDVLTPIREKIERGYYE